MANFTKANLEINIKGIEEYLEKINELEKKLIDVKSLIREISSMSLDVNFSGKEED